MAAVLPFKTNVPNLPPASLRSIPPERAPVRPSGFSMRDKIELERWSQAAARLGISRVRIEPTEPNDPPGTGGFLLVYLDGAEWARWGVAPREDGMVELWSMQGRGPNRCYGCLADALSYVAPV